MINLHCERWRTVVELEKKAQTHQRALGPSRVPPPRLPEFGLVYFAQQRHRPSQMETRDWRLRGRGNLGTADYCVLCIAVFEVCWDLLWIWPCWLLRSTG